ncbi:MAG: hypothetical protein A2W86_08830 [Bacteroidetes bacterium GWD2_45_23]|nr:MAG: hypothetical protein A2W87_09605 [Bacteroidetes bacterium GWC2_46_850]OFX76848.1 MAG: hypothetical protein A2071_02855 [Bacteroidetes bacterium GWC1_47_7]OFX87104.1 MAG: hypothetical protein A2W86_08830 [Bacteroidetes bacterium GWD2_45_23]HAR38367.1 hypothetical protein [Porphyromonadaceae bacterium]HBB01810.1 hypothetical protein [Porphyromonadaceae bacterium]
MMEAMFFENRSRYGFDETVNRLSEIVPENGWKVIQILDLQETMRKNGKEVLPVKVVELCKPDYAYQLLSDDALRIYANMMPCRISVYQKTDGQTYLSRMNSAMFAAQLGGVMQDVMGHAFSDAEGFIKQIAVAD